MSVVVVNITICMCGCCEKIFFQLHRTVQIRYINYLALLVTGKKESPCTFQLTFTTDKIRYINYLALLVTGKKESPCTFQLTFTTDNGLNEWTAQILKFCLARDHGRDRSQHLHFLDSSVQKYIQTCPFGVGVELSHL